MSVTVTAEAEKLALSHVPAGTEIGSGSSAACGKWPVDEMDAIPTGPHQLLRTPANSSSAALRKRAQESASKKAAGLAAASLASLDVLAASTGRSAELAAAGEMQQQPHQAGTHGDGQAPPSSGARRASPPSSSRACQWPMSMSRGTAASKSGDTVYFIQIQSLWTVIVNII